MSLISGHVSSLLYHAVNFLGYGFVLNCLPSIPDALGLLILNMLQGGR